MAASKCKEDVSLQNWETENMIDDVGTIEQVYGIGKTYEKEAPWFDNPEYFKCVKISAVALLRMIMHTRVKDQLEVRGYLEGKIFDETIIVVDIYTEPDNVSQGKKTKHMLSYFMAQSMIKQRRQRVGWYRSQPKHGCWLTQDVFDEQLKRQEEFRNTLIVIMIDPIKTISAGKVCLAAFRVYPRDYVPLTEITVQQPLLPAELKKEFLKNSKKYYPLKVKFFKTNIDKFLLKTMWHQYWIESLGSSNYLIKTEAINQRILSVADTLEEATYLLDKIALNDAPDPREKTVEKILQEASKESSKLVIETFTDSIFDFNKQKLLPPEDE